MIINSIVNPSHPVHDWDFLLTGGLLIQHTIDETIGDSLVVDSDRTYIHLVERPQRGNPKAILPAEDVTIQNAHILLTKHRVRMVKEETAEDHVAWQKLLKEVSGTIN